MISQNQLSALLLSKTNLILFFIIREIKLNINNLSKTGLIERVLSTQIVPTSVAITKTVQVIPPMQIISFNMWISLFQGVLFCLQLQISCICAGYISNILVDKLNAKNRSFSRKYFEIITQPPSHTLPLRVDKSWIFTNQRQSIMISRNQLGSSIIFVFSPVFFFVIQAIKLSKNTY